MNTILPMSGEFSLLQTWYKKNKPEGLIAAFTQKFVGVQPQ
jgi:hypothetical protein